ncbi:flagellar motor protein MotB [Kiloniella sp. b19]|uniref:flagellar motor protein MotB n=1 Tax=Kiloniella sp. GXU_MW_B19 TaxID=3141326 RepID=UPI0031DBA702
MADEQGDIIIKKVKKGHGGHHGGAWKIAYADFVTAMMAFFLLLWLLNATTEEQKEGIADYFSPSTQISKTTSGSDGLLAGQSAASKGALVSSLSNIGIEMNLPPEEEETDAEDEKDSEGANAGDEGELESGPETDSGAASDEQLKQYQEEQQQIQFEETAEALQVAIDANPELEGLADNILIDVTPDGLRIQLVDEENTSMFPSGSSNMAEKTEVLMGLVADAIKDLEQKVRISGHTDATPFAANNGFSNWELSAERANASRRALIKGGLATDRIASVVGLADTEPFVEEDPYSPTNRRISITLLKDTIPVPDQIKNPQKQRDSDFQSLDLDS